MPVIFVLLPLDEGKISRRSGRWQIEFERIEETLAEADKNYHILKKKKKVGRPQNPKRKRGKPKR